MGVNIKVRKSNLYIDNVYIVGLYISGDKLNNNLLPYSLEFVLKNKDKVYKLKKETLFDKVIDVDAFKYCYEGRRCLKNINIYYESIKISLKSNKIEDFIVEVYCRNKNEELLFEVKTKFICNAETWVEAEEKDNVFFICSDEKLLCQAKEMYNIVLKKLTRVFERKISDIKLYISSSYDIIYDIVKKLPIIGMDAFETDNCIFIISEFGKLKKSKLCHELCHIFINNVIYKKSAVDIKLIEGICEWISEEFTLEEETINLRKRCAIAFDVLNINKLDEYISILDCITRESVEYGLVMYNINPYVIKLIVERIGLSKLLDALNREETFQEVIIGTFDGLDIFWEVLKKNLNKDFDVKRYNELYAKVAMKQYEKISEDITVSAYNERKKKLRDIKELLNKEEYTLVKNELAKL